MLKSINNIYFKWLNKQILGIFLLCSILVIISACANNPLSSYTSNMEKPLNAISSGNINQVESALDTNHNILYYLEHGTVLRISDHYDQSNTEFTAAQAYIDAWVASYHNGTLGQTSDTLQASMVNDRVVDYSAKDYEKVMLPTYKALNYIGLGNISSARIEITRMYNIEDIIQNYREEQYTKEQEDINSNSQNSRNQFASLDQVESVSRNQYNFNAINDPKVLALKNSYQNAFSHYLAGFVFEALKEPSLARPGYVKAGELNPDNQLINQSINNIDKGIKPGNTMTDLLLVQEVGHAPQLKSVSFPIPFVTTQGQNTCTSAITISFPELVPDKQNYGRISLSVDGNQQSQQLFTDFNLMAARYLHDNLPNIFLRNTLRGAKDVALQQSACSGGGGIAGLITTIGTSILGQADERTWTMLPNQIYVTRMKVKRGKHTISVNTGVSSQNITVNLTDDYAVLSWRVIGSGIYFSPEQSMINK